MKDLLTSEFERNITTSFNNKEKLSAARRGGVPGHPALTG